MNRAFPIRGRVGRRRTFWSAALAGIALAAAMWFAVIPEVLRLHARHSRLVSTYNPRAVAIGLLALNVGLLLCLFILSVLIHRRGPRAERVR